MSTLHDALPRETAGRDTTLRFNMQHQAAAYAALEILENREVDRVYCDYHDDFVVRRRSPEGAKYHFFQVKTRGKANYQWDLRDVFALKKRAQKADQESLRAIQDSFAGKLFLHALTFKSACHEVTLLTNVHFNDDVQNAVNELRSGTPTSKEMSFLIDKLGEVFEVALGRAAAIEIGKKLSLLSDIKYIGDQQKNFAVGAREAIFNYSEIDLSHDEAAEIAAGLVALVQKKSMSPIAGLSPSQLDEDVGVGLSDLLSILSISPQAYYALLAGEDPKALRTASFLQRRLLVAGATDDMIEFATQRKVEWDIWVRNARHVYTEMDLNFLFEKVNELRRGWLRSGGKFTDLRVPIESAMSDPNIVKMQTLTVELVLGGIMADWVRRGEGA